MCVGSKLKCPLFVASEMSGFKVVPCRLGRVGFGDEVQGKGAVSLSLLSSVLAFPGSGGICVIATEAMRSVGETQGSIRC